MKPGPPERTALVTGGSRGIGAAIVQALACDGCRVAFNHWQDPGGAAEVVSRLQDLGHGCLAVETDVSDLEAAERMVARVVEELGRLDLLICNAGVTADRAVWNMTEGEWDRVIAVNLKGCFNYCRAAAKVFRAQRSGRIVNITSINGLRGKFGQANYAASKGGMVALTKTLAKELGRYGVNVNAVAPGMVDTAMAKALPEEYRRAAVEESVLGRLAEPQDVANLVLFLCSEGARHITGTCIRIDGGQAI